MLRRCCSDGEVTVRDARGVIIPIRWDGVNIGGARHGGRRVYNVQVRGYPELARVGLALGERSTKSTGPTDGYITIIPEYHIIQVIDQVVGVHLTCCISTIYDNDA